MDLWEEFLSLLAVRGHEVHSLQVPSHIGFRGNHKADELADVGRRKCPLMFGHISVNMVGTVENGAEEEEEFDEQSLLGMGEEEPIEEEDLCVHSTPLHRVINKLCTPIQTSPQMQRQRGHPPPPPGSGGWLEVKYSCVTGACVSPVSVAHGMEVEACTPFALSQTEQTPLAPPLPTGSTGRE